MTNSGLRRPSDAQGTHPAVILADLDKPSLHIISGTASHTSASLVLGQRSGRTEFVDSILGTEDAILNEASKRDPATASRSEYLSKSPHLTVGTVICTLGEHPRLPEAVQALLRQTIDADQVIVVDNAPDTGATRAALRNIEDPRLIIVDEPQRGLSHARNSAIDACSMDVLAFTDDDAIADQHWLESLLRPLFVDHVTCVTGLVLPAELRTKAQREFEKYVGFGKGVLPLWWNTDATFEHPHLGWPGPRGPLFPFTTGKIGSGNSMAFRREALVQVGGFDPTLGAGTRAEGGEDLDIFGQLLQQGHTIAYTPDAIVWHYHRETLDELRRQIRSNGVGMAAVLCKAFARDPKVGLQVARAVGPVARATLTSRGRKNIGVSKEAGSENSLRRILIAEEALGLAQGPFKYARSRYLTR